MVHAQEKTAPQRRAKQIREAVPAELHRQTGDEAMPGLKDVAVGSDVLHALVARSNIGRVSRSDVQRALARLRDEGKARRRADGWQATPPAQVSPNP